MKYYFVICQSQERPDGPANLIGPFKNHDEAMLDIYNVIVWEPENQGIQGCSRKHLIGWWNEIPSNCSVYEGAIISRECREAFEDGGRELILDMLMNRERRAKSER